MLRDPLAYYYRKFGFDAGKIQRVSVGRKYLGIQLKNGHIGVCSTLGIPESPGHMPTEEIDLTVRAHRIFYNAYLNALLNYDAVPEETMDIFEHIDFKSLDSIVMIGFFRPLVKKFTEAGIPLRIFDKIESDPQLTPMEMLDEHLATSAAVILTSTSIFNRTFSSVLSKLPPQAEVFLLGPSSILHPDMMKYPNVCKVYGAVFPLNDQRVLDLIGQGHGTRTFMKYGQKVNI